jgi:hypothetical protein
MLDAYNAVPHQVTAPFGFGEVLFSPNSATRLQARYSHFDFTDHVNRDRADIEVLRSIVVESPAKLNLGWRTNFMRHNLASDDFYSPLQFQSHLAVVQGSGHISRLAYFGEIAGGWQSEWKTPTLHPLQLSGKLVWHASRNWSATLEAGRSTSSLDRPSPGLRTYNRRVISASIELRLP